MTCAVNWSVPDSAQAAYLADATGVTTFCYEIRLLRSWSQVAKSVAVNSLRRDLRELRLTVGEGALGSFSGPHLGGGSGMREKKGAGGQEGWKPAPGAEALSHSLCYPGSDRGLSLTSQLPSCSQSH